MFTEMQTAFLVLASGFEEVVSGFVPVLLFRQVLLVHSPALQDFLPHCIAQNRLDTNTSTNWKIDGRIINGQLPTKIDAISYHLSIM